MDKIDITKLDDKDRSELTIVSAEDQISRDLDGEAVILNMKTGVYCGLNETGARIWQLIHKPVKFHKLLDILIDEYNAETEQCSKDLIEILNKLNNNKLIKIYNEENK
jgi:hypothetical protein